MPLERLREVDVGVLDMDDTAVIGRYGLSRSMPEERSDRQDAASGNRADPGLRRRGLAGREPSAVRAGNDLQSAVVRAARIEVKAKVDHVLEDPHRRLDMGDASLRGPGAELLELIGAVRDGDGGVLMPRHVPVALGCLVEEERSNRKGRRGERLIDDVAQRP